jgi:hypothetical protein
MQANFHAFSTILLAIKSIRLFGILLVLIATFLRVILLIIEANLSRLLGGPPQKSESSFSIEIVTCRGNAMLWFEE